MSNKNFEDCLGENRTNAETAAYYDNWANQYEKDQEEGKYNGPKLIADAFLELKVQKGAKILDLAAGTGKVAKLLHPHGYTNMDAIDGSEGMLAHARKEGLYCKYIHSLIGRGQQCPIEDETYDVLISAGSFAPGHLYSDSFPEILRIVKKGGIICWVMRKYETKSPAFVTFFDDVNKLVTSGSWEFVMPRRSVKEYWLGDDGWIYVMKKV